MFEEGSFHLPEKYKREFIYLTCRENIFRLTIIAGGLSVVELFVAIFVEEYKTNTFFLSFFVSIGSLIFFPILLLTYKKINQCCISWIMAVQTICITGIIFAGVFWSLLEQSTFASGNTFILCIFVLSALISISPVKGTMLFLFAFLAFSLLLPRYQLDSEVVSTLRVNAFCMSLLAAIINRIVFRNQLLAFKQNKIIEEKNKELEEKNLVLTEMAMRDSMTSLFNHKYSFRLLKEEIERAKRIGYPLSVAMIDLDNFKMINDAHGHLIGDEILIQVAKMIRLTCRSTDVIGRYGGEEFIVIMPNTTMEEAALLMKRLQTNIKEAQFEVMVTLSCGISQLREESAHGLIRSSDLMLYRAKKKGKDRIEMNIIKDKKSAGIN